jgi:hypothetical protein
MRRVVCLVACLALVAGAAPRAQSVEDEVKAAFLYNFAKFVEWPAGAFAAPDEPIRFCLVGPDPFGRAIDDLLEGERVRGRPLAVRRLENVTARSRCHILFVSPAPRERYASLLRAVDTRRVLTVSDDLSFLAAGGHISFFIEGSRVRFAVNQAATATAEFRMSSKLLQVARRPESAQTR